ncbi:MAG: Uma2 family endonuclease [Anaerolineae bacterium]|nr:Uma2 family endonuclease [Anaerolineae bacterium]
MALRIDLATIREFETFMAQPENRDGRFELIHGEIIEKAMPTELHGLIVANLIALLWSFVKQTGRGRVGAEIRNRMPGDDHNSRQPDISYFADASRPIVERGAVPQMPDLAIEVKSPDDSYKAMREKADYYLANGAGMVWLILTEKREVEVHRPGKLDVLTESDILDGGTVLPDFTLPVREIFPS